MQFINLDLRVKDRYDLSKFLEYTDNYDPLTSYFLTELLKLSPYGKYAVQSDDTRPELIAYKIYGDVQYWWIILLYNSLTTWDEITTEMVLSYPAVEHLEDLYFRLRSLETGKT